MSREKEEETNVRLEWRDYIALTIATLQTTLFPIIVSIFVLLLLALVLRR